MIKGVKDIIILALALCTLVIAAVFMPWSELNFTGDFPNWISALTSALGINKVFAQLGTNPALMKLVKLSDAQYNLGDYAYALFLFCAVTASAIAIVLIGKEENTEKTVLEVKK